MTDHVSPHNRFQVADGVPACAAPPRRQPIVIGTLRGPWLWLLTAGCLAGVAGTGVLDYATGPALSLSIFYLIPVAICAWWGGFAHGILLALAGAVAWNLVDGLENPWMTAPVGLWNGVVRFGTLVMVSSLVSRLHAGVMRERLLARTDPLTGAANARTFYEAVALEAERATRTNRPLTLAYLDLDNFKRLNDQLGHAAGDAALVDLVRLIRPSLRAADVLARLGGDEFALLLPETDGDGAVALLTRMQAVLKQEMADAGRPLTASVGAVTFLRPLWDVDLMIQQVDGLMYAAKRRGKNRVEHAIVREAQDAGAGERLRLERRATARSVCDRQARVRQEGESPGDEVPATIRNLCADGVALRMDRHFADGSLLIVEPLSHQARTLLARVVRSSAEADGWLHGCELAAPLDCEELRSWLSSHVHEVQL